MPVFWLIRLNESDILKAGLHKSTAFYRWVRSFQQKSTDTEHID